MKRIILILPILLALISCEENISLQSLEQESRLQLYAFPCDCDSFLINVSLTQPVFGKAGRLDITEVSCTTNGLPDQVQLLHTETHNGLPLAIYKATGKHRPGDEIHITVRDASRPTATASTFIPQDVPPAAVTCDTAYVPDQKIHYTLSLQDPSAGEHYYAVRIFQRGSVVSDGFYPSVRDSVLEENIYQTWNLYYGTSWFLPHEYPYNYDIATISTELEHKLCHYLDINFDPWNEYYKGLYFFSSRDFTSPADQFHLYTTPTWHSSHSILQYFILSPDFHKMLRRINDQLSNEMAESGLTTTFATYNNVRGGYGCVAGYICHEYLDEMLK